MHPAVLLPTIMAAGWNMPLSPAGTTFLQNRYIIAGIEESTISVRAGSLSMLTDIETGLDLADGHQFCGVQSWGYIPMNGTVTALSDTEAVFVSPGMIDYATMTELPISVTIEYRLVGRSLEIRLGLMATGEAELLDPLEVDFWAGPFSRVDVRNQTAMDRSVQLDHTHDSMRFSCDQIVEMHRDDDLLDAVYLIPNPTDAIFRLEDCPEPSEPSLTLLLFDSEIPRETATGPLLHSTLPAGYSRQVFLRIDLEQEQGRLYLSAHPDGFERTASMMLDDVPFRHPPDTTIWAFSETSSGGEYASAWLIALLEAHPQLRMNWVMLPDAIMLDNCDSMWAEPGWESSWSHWHSTWRMATLAPQPFLDWLRNIQDHVYPWSDRVTLGSHGYHHTPSPDSAWNPYHEFILYQPEEHYERFRVMRDDYAAAGLDTTLITAIRYPGHRTSQSGLMAAIRYGYTFYCNGVRWFEWYGGEPYWNQHLTRFVSPDGTIWGTNTVWWADYASQYPIEYLTAVLDRGKHALTGGHPSQMWFNGDPIAYARVDSICTMMEATPHFGWLLPEEYGSFLDGTSSIQFTSIRSTPAGVEAEFTGSAGQGQTLVVEPTFGQQVQWVKLDGDGLVWEQRGDRVFVFPGDVQPGSHSIQVMYIQTGVEEEPPPPAQQVIVTAGNPFGSSLGFQAGWFPPGSAVAHRLVDMSGRTIASGSCTADASGSVLGEIDASGLPPGVYFLALDGDGIGTAAVRLTHLPD